MRLIEKVLWVHKKVLSWYHTGNSYGSCDEKMLKPLLILSFEDYQ